MTNNAPSLDQLRQLSQELGEQLIQHRLTLSLAESCTGGLLASILTDIPGSSHYVAGGVVSYSNEAKMQVLGVRPETLEAHGAVSAETAAEMARGVRALLHSDLAISVTGIAGPGGGTPEKPVGLVYLHLSSQDVEWGEMHIWPHDRIGNKQATVAAGLRLALRYVQERTAPVDPRQESADAQALPTVLVEAEWSGDSWRPRAVWLQGRRQRVTGVGRQQRTDEGVWVMTVEFADGSRAELVADAGSGVWLLRRHWPARRFA